MAGCHPLAGDGVDGFRPEANGSEDFRSEPDGSGIRIQAHSQHYSLRWHNHQGHLLHYFEALQQGERLVDVTLVCDDTSVRAHKVVLSACSSYLQRLLAECPCKHPVLILQGIRGWELQALVSFMYRGEISVPQECIASLVKVAETLMVRGLSKVDPVFTSPSPVGPSGGNLLIPASLMPKSFSPDEDCALPPAAKIPHLAAGVAGSLPFALGGAGSFAFDARTSPLARRKQARPRRRSGDSLTLSEVSKASPSPTQEAPEDLSVKKSPLPDTPMKCSRDDAGDDSSRNDSRDTTPLPAITPPAALKLEHSFNDSLLKTISNHEMLQTPQSLPIQQDRRKGQHSAPRGGPPRAWTNADLTEALHHVWNRKMTTSQASRVFGIPYNSLLMYVRGKYGKSLKLDTLRKETLEGEAMALAASTRGSYKLAATSSSSSASSASSTPSAATNKNTSPLGIGSATAMSNPGSDSLKLKGAQPPLAGSPFGLGNYSSLGEDGHPGLAGLALGGLGGLAAAAAASGINPYLSYFCDFSFPVPMMGLVPPSAGSKLLNSNHQTGDSLKEDQKVDCSGSEPEEETNNNNTRKKPIDVEDEETGGTSSPSPQGPAQQQQGSQQQTTVAGAGVRLNRTLMAASLDLSQTGQV